MRRSTDAKDDIGRGFKRRRVTVAESATTPSRTESVQEHHKQGGESHGGTSVNDNAMLWQGDNYLVHNHYHSPTFQQDKPHILLESLTFDRMDTRLRNVATALPNTCQWFFDHEQFRAWIDTRRTQEHHGFLWIKGKPGSGKSTIMKETLTWATEKWSSSQIVLSYFFNARSPHQLEKSSLGLYRSLLHQLLCALPSSRTLFESAFASKVRDDKVEEWTQTELQNFLIELVTTLQLPFLNIFIDALDEGSDDDVRQMLKFLEHLTRHATAAGRLLRICLSSRYYPYISIEKGLSFNLEDQVGHGQDIETYIRNELTGGHSPQMRDLRYEIRHRSAGVFLWVILIVPMLNKAYDQGKSSLVMLRKLQEIPLDLYDVFAQVFSKDLENLNECIILLEWVLYSMQPLSLTELYCAVQYTCSNTDTNEDTAITPDAVARYLLDCSRGLTELTKAEPFTVQFIHETVRGYLLNRNVLERCQPNAYISARFLPGFESDSCHMKLAERCLRYLLRVCKKRTFNWAPTVPISSVYGKVLVAALPVEPQRRQFQIT